MRKSKTKGQAQSFQTIIKIINKVYRFSFHIDYSTYGDLYLLFLLNANLFCYGVSKTQISSTIAVETAASLTELRMWGEKTNPNPKYIFCKTGQKTTVIQIFRHDLAPLIKGESGMRDLTLVRRRSILTTQKVYLDQHKRQIYPSHVHHYPRRDNKGIKFRATPPRTLMGFYARGKVACPRKVVWEILRRGFGRWVDVRIALQASLSVPRPHQCNLIALHIVLIAFLASHVPQRGFPLTGSEAD